MVSEVNQAMAQHPQAKVYISRNQGRPAMYYWFYSKTNPKLVHKAEKNSAHDQGEFLEYQNITFFRDNPNFDDDELIVAVSPPLLQLPAAGYSQAKQLAIIKNLTGDLVWQVIYTKK
jgi:hypothetical protein